MAPLLRPAQYVGMADAGIVWEPSCQRQQRAQVESFPSVTGLDRDACGAASVIPY